MKNIKKAAVVLVAAELVSAAVVLTGGAKMIDARARWATLEARARWATSEPVVSAHWTWDPSAVAGSGCKYGQCYRAR
jgi:surface antigen